MAKRKIGELCEKPESAFTKKPGAVPSEAKSGLQDDTLITRVNALPIAELITSHVPQDSLCYRPRTKEQPIPVTKDIAFDISVRSSPLCPDKSQAATDEDMETCFNLVETTSGDAYRLSGFGWHPKRKKREMREPEMRYLLVRKSQKTAPDSSLHHTQPSDSKANDRVGDPGSESSPISGFCSFRLTHEDGFPVIYIYEIHLGDEVLRCGLGSHLLNIVEAIGQSVGVAKAMLTVFRSNEHARAWYNRAGYEVDEYSPPDKKLRGGKVKQADYLILSKTLQDRSSSR